MEHLSFLLEYEIKLYLELNLYQYEFHVDLATF